MTVQQTLSGSESRAASHICSQPGCERWGGWGFDPGGGVIGWWCAEHRPEADPVTHGAPVSGENWVSDGNEG